MKTRNLEKIREEIGELLEENRELKAVTPVAHILAALLEDPKKWSKNEHKYMGTPNGVDYRSRDFDLVLEPDRYSGELKVGLSRADTKFLKEKLDNIK